jgi:hypothetical protein
MHQGMQVTQVQVTQVMTTHSGRMWLLLWLQLLLGVDKRQLLLLLLLLVTGIWMSWWETSLTPMARSKCVLLPNVSTIHFLCWCVRADCISCCAAAFMSFACVLVLECLLGRSVCTHAWFPACFPAVCSAPPAC